MWRKVLGGWGELFSHLKLCCLRLVFLCLFQKCSVPHSCQELKLICWQCLTDHSPFLFYCKWRWTDQRSDVIQMWRNKTTEGMNENDYDNCQWWGSGLILGPIWPLSEWVTHNVSTATQHLTKQLSLILYTHLLNRLTTWVIPTTWEFSPTVMFTETFQNRS